MPETIQEITAKHEAALAEILKSADFESELAGVTLEAAVNEAREAFAALVQYAKTVTTATKIAREIEGGK